MATRKMKRYAEGDYVEDDAVPTAEQNAKNIEDAGTVELERVRDTAASQPSNFKEAFAAARSAGDKTFEFGGKKYTTELAGSKTATKPAAKPAAKSAAPSRSVAPRGDDTANPDVKQGPKKGQYMSLQDRARSYETERAKSGVGMYGTRKSEPAETKRTPGRGVINTRDIDPDTLLPKKMAKGGDVKGWGIARGARKAKMY
jgi:hypothetical protein